MRTLKFRAYHERWGWAKPEDITVYGNGTYYVDYRGENGDIVGTYDEKCKQLHLFQCIGLNDKNGREIYEGDIVKVHEPGMLDDEFETMQVKWGGHYPAFDVYHMDGRYHENEYNLLGCDETGFEVIGNIWEHPELLKGDA